VSPRLRSGMGLVLQCVALAMPPFIVWRAGLPAGDAAAAVRISAGLVLVVAGLALFAASVRALGVQWSLIARARDGHALVTGGPYGIVRHPIYVATGVGLLGAMVVAGRAGAGVAAAALYVAGTPLRARAEEDVLRSAFGTRYDAYARRVPAWGVRAPRRVPSPRAIERADAGATGGTP
jgi:protein-S-isoprenylcysteine O-methyltransferase Ste14